MIVRTVIVGPKGHADRYPGAAEELMLLGPGALIDLVAEPENQHDAKAVACYSNGVHLGYIPVSCAAKSQIFDRLTDQEDMSAEIVLEAIVDDGRIVELPRIHVIWEE